MLTLDQVTLTFEGTGPNHIQIDASLAAGEICAITGPSGVGKSSLLLAIAGFHNITSGDMRWHDTSFLKMPVWQRPLSCLFQSDNLFPHLSAAKNIALGALKTQEKHEIDLKTAQITSHLGISDILHKPCAALSGGQQQRVGLARALLRAKPILLLDEPFSALDHDNRQKALALVKNITLTHRLATIIVTHDEDDIDLLGAKSLRLQRQTL